ncbi:putative nucleoprotein [Lishi spider virus 1]|uniref:Putative nucleoprotein n=1 Tax=Lishi spider virus 1 TaxID=1608057 RepID=A0A0B5KJV2_9VIRU|nr:putative nucleoprotein [Lishi spider virus 1]AJG39050.1 putative nucleoprotein [Lishi spider virus 1]
MANDNVMRLLGRALNEPPIDEPVGLRGPCMNTAFFSKWLRQDIIFQKVGVRSIDVAPFQGDFDDNLVPTMIHLYSIGKFLHYKPQSTVSRAAVLAITCAETLGPSIGTDRLMTQHEARQSLCHAVCALRNSGLLATFTSATAQTYGALVGNDRPAQWTDTDWDSTDVEANCRVLRHMALRAEAAYTLKGSSLIVHMLVAIIKRGTMSDAFVDKIQQGIQTDLSLPIRISAETCRIFYSSYCSELNDVGMSFLLSHLDRLIPTHALRLRLTIQQASGSGLTALVLLGRAFRMYENFNWPLVAKWYPDEWANFTAAVDSVGNNLMYGYRRDIGPAKSTKFRSLTFIAKELLIRVGGETSLRNYAGFATRVKNHDAVINLINTYVDRITAAQAEVEVGDAESEAVNQFRQTVVEHANVYG